MRKEKITIEDLINKLNPIVTQADTCVEQITIFNSKEDTE